jgi:multiple antibiotic resistance protein
MFFVWDIKVLSADFTAPEGLRTAAGRRRETRPGGTGTIARPTTRATLKMPLDYLVSALVTLLVVVDPIGLAPTFLAVTAGLPNKARRDVAIRACIIAGAILAGAALAGQWLFSTLGISLAAFRIAGGLMLFSIATEMVFGVRIRHEGETAEQALEEQVSNIAAFPLAIPLMAGPGAITATVLLAGQAGGNLVLLGALLGVVALVCAACLVVFLFAGRIARLLGVTGTVVLSRLLGVVLAALAVQYVVDGIRAFFFLK